MAHPKRKISKTRRDKRRTHIKAKKQQIAISKATGECVFTSLKQVAVKVRDVKAHYPKLKVRVYHASLWEEN